VRKSSLVFSIIINLDLIERTLPIRRIIYTNRTKRVEEIQSFDYAVFYLSLVSAFSFGIKRVSTYCFVRLAVCSRKTTAQHREIDEEKAENIKLIFISRTILFSSLSIVFFSLSLFLLSMIYR
jgi:CO dehydrogenase/acetyl-CoA synthase beta subunit